MTIRLDSDIRPADATPPYCSSCRGQYPDKRHIDFDAPCDRGYTYGGDDAVGAKPVSMDWLILCEDCLRTAAELTGMVTEETAQKLEKANEKLVHEAEVAEREREKAERYAGTLELAFDTRPQPIKIDHRKKPRVRNA